MNAEPSPGHRVICCYCAQKTVEHVREQISKLRLKTVDEVYQHVLGGGGCNSCRCEIEKLLAEQWGPEDAGPPRQ